MLNLGAYTQDVQFNWTAAEDLVRELRSTATVLGNQVGERTQINARARELWEGSYAQQFDGRMNICIRDTQRFIPSMQVAAGQLEQLAMLARQEQQRRLLARQWVAQRAAYAAAGLPPPPPPPGVTPPIEPPSIPITDSAPMQRGAFTPAGGGKGQSSADPDHLDRWVNTSRGLDRTLSLRQAAVEGIHDVFISTSRWGYFDASALIGSITTYIGYNEEDAKQTSRIAGAFRQADSSGGVVTVPDAVIEAWLTAAGGKRAWPTDPLTGNPLTDHDLEFLGLTHKQIEWWRNGEAPLGMTPQTYRKWATSLRDALREDGIPPETVDVRLLGSAARGFSGPHKQIPTEQQITEEFPQDVAHTAIERRRGWLGDAPERLKGRPFDSLNKLGLDEPSDYDTNISNDLMVDKARAWWEANGRPGDFLIGDHKYVNKDIAREVFPNLHVWREAWSNRLGRDVSVAVFPGSGPKDVSASGHFVHFQDDDWIVHRPEGS